MKIEMNRLIADLKKPQPDAERKAPANMLQAIRTRFTSGRPRKVPLDMLSAMFAVMTCNNERDRIAAFIGERGGNAGDFVIAVSVVGMKASGTDYGRGVTRTVPDTLEEIVELADKLKKMDAIFAGMLVSVHDKTGAAVRYMRPFIVSPEASEILSLASLQQRFKRSAN
jgi:hypothetical protein